MSLKEEIKKIENQSKQISDIREDIKDIMDNLEV